MRLCADWITTDDYPPFAAARPNILDELDKMTPFASGFLVADTCSVNETWPIDGSFSNRRVASKIDTVRKTVDWIQIGLGAPGWKPTPFCTSFGVDTQHCAS